MFIQLGVPTRCKQLYWGDFVGHIALDRDPVRAAEMPRPSTTQGNQGENIPLERTSTRKSQRSTVSRIYVTISPRK